MSTLTDRIEEVMAAMNWEHADLVRVSGESSSLVSQWRGKTDKPINKITKIEALVRIERASGFSAVWISTGKLPKRVGDPWPFSFDRSRFDALEEREKGMVEHAARAELERLERERASKGLQA